MKADILVVDDTPENLRLLEETLKQNHYAVRSAINGNLALLGARLDKPDLILLDINMPGMNGYEVCQAFKQDPNICDIPIIFLSASHDSVNKVKAFQGGGVDYISKPFQVDEVLARIEHQLTIQRQQQQIQEQNQALEESNQRLENFASTVAHDLKQPLQSLMLSGGILERRYGSESDAMTQRHLANISKASESMNQLVQGLLDFSKVGDDTAEFEPVDMNQVLEQVQGNLQALIERKQAKITAATTSLPTLQAHPLLLVQLLQNLIGNGLKFQHEDSLPVVEITATPWKEISETDCPELSRSDSLSSESWLFEVRDNGIGIDQDKCGELFEIFKRLHSREEYPGHGIGLSTCQKIVEYHGGDIWIKSEPGVGTSVYFILENTLQ